MTHRDRYEAMSDEELIATLREHLSDGSWTLAQMVELERRGFDAIESDEELHAAITEKYAALQEKLRTAFEPLIKRTAAINEQFARQVGASFLPKRKFDVAPWRLPHADLPTTASGIEALAPLSSTATETVLGDLDPIVDRVRARAEKDVEIQEQMLVLQGEQLGTLRELHKEVERSNRRGWFDWAVLAAAVVAAVGTIVAVVLAL